MAAMSLDEDTIDEILYLSRANEAAELSTFLSNLAASIKRSNTDMVAAAIDPYTKNTALHYAAANGHAGTRNDQPGRFDVDEVADPRT